MTEQTQTKPKTRRKPAQSKEVAAPAEFSPIKSAFDLIQTAVSRGASPEELRELMDIRREIQAEHAERRFREAHSAFLSDLPIIKKQKVARFPSRNGGAMVEYWYASLDDIVEAIKPYLKRHGLSFRWEQTVHDNGGITERCILSHEDGHSESSPMSSMLDQSGGKNPIQMIGSTSAYLRRYTLTGVAGIATADQDIDGRLPDGEGSETLEGMLNADEDEADEISEHIADAGNMTDLNTAGTMIAEFPDGRLKERLKREWFEAKKRLVKAESEDNQEAQDG